MNEKFLLKLKEKRKIINKKQQKEKENRNSKIFEDIKLLKQKELKEEKTICNKEIKNFKIPKMFLDTTKLNFKHVNLEKNIILQKWKLKQNIPNIKLITPYFTFLNINIDKSFNIVKAKNNLYIPKIKILKPENKYIQNKLNSEVLILKYEEKSLVVPKISISKALFDIVYFRDFKMTKSLEIKEECNIQKEKQKSVISEIKRNLVTKAYYRDVDTFVSNFKKIKQTKIREIIEPIEFLFGHNVEELKKIEPLIILFKDYKDDNYIQTFEALLLRIYREKYGGLPEVKKLSLKDDWNKYEIEKYLDEGNIFLIELDFEDNNISISKDNLADRLWSIFSKGRGIVIFYTKSEYIFEKYKTILNEINWKKLNLKANIIEIIPKKLSFEEKINILKVLFGFVDIGEEVPHIAPMDAIFNFAKEKYKGTLEKIKNKYYINLGIINEGENESEEHINLKSFIVHCLVNKLEKDGIIPKNDNEKDWDNIKENIIKTEYLKDGKNGNIIVDLYFVNKNENYEIETLFGNGFRKIHRTLEKYNSNEKINIIVENITAFLHVKEFLKLIDLIKKKQRYKNLKVNFYTLDIKNNKLISLEDFYFKINEIIKSKK